MEDSQQKIIYFIIFFLIIIISLGIFTKSNSFLKNSSTKDTSNIVTEPIINNKEVNENKVDTRSYTEEKARFFFSEDNKFYLILTSNFRAYSNPDMGTTERRFLMNIDEFYSTDSFTGTYKIENNKIILNIEAGCLDKDNNFNCVVPDGINIEKKEDINTISLDYNETQISFGKVILTKQN